MVAITHRNRKMEAAADECISCSSQLDIAFNECCHVVAASSARYIICEDPVLLVSSWRRARVRQCQVNGSRINAPIPLQPLGTVRIEFWCRTPCRGRESRIWLELQVVALSRQQKELELRNRSLILFVEIHTQLHILLLQLQISDLEYTVYSELINYTPTNFLYTRI